MKTYRMPHTDLDVSRLSYGTWHLGGSWDDSPLTDETRRLAQVLINTAVDHGINMIDLADIYTRGKSDEVVGHVLAQQPGLRDRLVLQAKAGIILGDDTAPGRYDFSYDHIVTAVEGTLRRLQTDYVDVLLLHRPDPLVEPEEVARAFDELHSSGKVRYFGVSNHTPMQMTLLQKYTDHKLVANQIELNLLHNQLINEGIVANTADVAHTAVAGTLDYCRLHDIMIQAWSPVAGGQLFNPGADAAPHVQAAAQEIARQAAAYETTKEAIALAWLLRHPAGIQPIIGTQNPARIAASCRADDVAMSRIDWYRLLEAANGTAVP